MSAGEHEVGVQSKPQEAAGGAQGSAILVEESAPKTRFSAGGAIPPAGSGWSNAPPTASELAFGSHPGAGVVQRNVAPGEAPAADPIAAARHGTSGASTTLPYLERIQRSFGRHDVSGTRAHVGGSAAEASSALGARAFAHGDSVAFASAPDLHTAAHEAAHVVQQRGGVSLKGDIDGGASDPHERHADAVADKVVRGESAETLLDAAPGGDASGAAVQRSPGGSSELPGQMITVTLLGASSDVVAKTSVPLYSQAQHAAYVGDVVGGAIQWRGQGISVQLGTKFDRAHRPIDGESLEAWVKQHGRSAVIVVVEVDGTLTQAVEKPAEKPAEKKAWFEDPDAAAPTTPAAASATPGAGTKPTTSTRQAKDGPGGPDAETHDGTTTQTGHDGARTKDDGHPRGTRTAGKPHGVEGGRDGGRFGSSDGTKKKVGWAWDPDHPGKGDQDTAPDSATPDGMLGGDGKPGDQGAPDVGALTPSLKVPKSIRAAVDIAVILVQGDIAGAADDLISVARELGANATKKALSPFVLAKINGIVDRELPKAMEQLAKDSEFAAKSATEQTQIARQALQQEATDKLALELDSRISGADKAEKIDRENLSGPNAEYAKADLDEEQQTAEAAKRVREAVPSEAPASSDTAPKVHEGKQGKHVAGHNNYTPGRSRLTADPNELAKAAGTGAPVGKVARGAPGFKERVDFGRVIGDWVDEATGASYPTTKGIIIYARDGTIHIVPARP